MNYMSCLLAVRDIKRSISFYRTVLGLDVIADLGANVTLTGGIALQTLDSWRSFIHTDTVIFSHNAGELYFEETDIDAFVRTLADHPEIQYVHPLIEHAWGQRVIRFYDPDGHIIEVGEALSVVMHRFQSSGLSVKQIAARMDIPLDAVRSGLAVSMD